MSQDDRSYFLQRAEAEAASAAKATDPAVASIHHQLAAAYRDRLKWSDRSKRYDA